MGNIEHWTASDADPSDRQLLADAEDTIRLLRAKGVRCEDELKAVRQQHAGAVVLDDDALARGLAAVMVTNSPDNREALRRALTTPGGR